MKPSQLITTIALTATAFTAFANERISIGMSGFSAAVRNEQGVRTLKEIGADYASGVPMTDCATLDLFAKYGLTAEVGGLPGWWGGKTELVGKMAEQRPLSVFEAAAKKWRPHPAIREVVIGDEPGKPDLAHYGKVFDFVKAKMPGAVPGTTILPDYGSHIARGDAEARVQLGTDSYEDYVRSFCELVPAAEKVRVDFYPYSAPPETRASYLLRRYRVMAIAARAARDYGRQLSLYVQANSLFKELAMDIHKMRYMAFTDLAFGATDLKFTCYTPSWWENNILEKDGSKTPRYAIVQKLISEIRAFDREYMRFRCTGTRFIGFPAGEIAAIGDAADVRWYDSTAMRGLAAADGGRLVVGEMLARDGSGESALLIASADDPEGINVHQRLVTFRGPAGVKAWNREGPVEPTRHENGSYSLDLPSDGVLLVVAPLPPDPLRLSSNPDDQFRRLSPTHPQLRQAAADMGFTVLGCTAGRTYDFKTGQYPDKEAAALAEALKECRAAGADGFSAFNWPRNKVLAPKYPRLRRNGSPVPGKKGTKTVEVDAAHPEFRACYRKAVGDYAAKVGRNPDLLGFSPFEEIRLRNAPSYTDYNAARYRADTGREIPSAAKGRAAPHWSKIPDLPKNRIVSEHHPLLAFYRWFWQKGDGWNELDDISLDAFEDATGGRKIFSTYSPCLRIPPLYGIGGGVSHLGNWIYSYDDPVNCDYPIAKIVETARGTPGKYAIAGLQLITHRDRIAGGNDVKGAPEWTRKYPNCGYPNMPADMLGIGLWTAFARQIDGLSFHSWQCIFDGEKYGVDPNGGGYQFTDPEEVKVLRKFFAEVAVPLGPLFRAVPERTPKVAVFESWASAIFSGIAPPFWEIPQVLSCGVAASAANLMPASLFEEGLQRDGVPASVKVLLLPMCPVLTESAFVKLRDFQRRGGKLIAADDLAPALTADASLPVDTSKTQDKASVKETSFRRTAVELRRTVERFCEPTVGSDNPYIHVHARGEKAYDLLFAVNDRRGPGPYVGVYERVLDNGLPTDGSISLVRDAKAVYDLVRHERVTNFTVANGRLTIPLHLDGSDGRVFLVADRPLAPLAAKITHGADGVAVEVTSPDADVMIPIRVARVNAKPYYGVVKGGRWRHVFAAGEEVAAVTNLADGQGIAP